MPHLREAETCAGLRKVEGMYLGHLWSPMVPCEGWVGSHVLEAWCLDGGEAWLDMVGVQLALLESMLKEGPPEGSLKVTETFMFSSVSSGDIRVTTPRTPRGLDQRKPTPGDDTAS